MRKAKTHLVFVDDDLLVLESIRANLRKSSLCCETHTFFRPEEALDFLKEHSVDAVISDEVMPEMLGTTFLEEVQRIDPTVSLILLTGQASVSSVKKAVSDIGVYMFIEKPCAPTRMEQVLHLAVRHTAQRRSTALSSVGSA